MIESWGRTEEADFWSTLCNEMVPGKLKVGCPQSASNTYNSSELASDLSRFRRYLTSVLLPQFWGPTTIWTSILVRPIFTQVGSRTNVSSGAMDDYCYSLYYPPIWALKGAPPTTDDYGPRTLTLRIFPSSGALSKRLGSTLALPSIFSLSSSVADLALPLILVIGRIKERRWQSPDTKSIQSPLWLWCSPGVSSGFFCSLKADVFPATRPMHSTRPLLTRKLSAPSIIIWSLTWMTGLGVESSVMSDHAWTCFPPCSGDRERDLSRYFRLFAASAAD